MKKERGVKMSVGKRLKELRIKRNYTQQYVADILGIGRSNLGHIEHDRVALDSKHAKILAELYNTSYDYIYTGEGEEYTDPDLKMIARYGKKMTPEQRKKTRRMIEMLFDEFADDKNKE